MLHVHITLACVRDPDVPTLPATSMALMRGLLCRPRRVGASRLGAKQLTDVGSKCGNPPYFDLFSLRRRSH